MRRGRKWHAVAEARLQLDDGSLSPSVKLRTELRKFPALAKADIRFEHDPACRSFDGLLRVLKDAYPGFRAEEVTLCHFDFDERRMPARCTPASHMPGVPQQTTFARNRSAPPATGLSPSQVKPP